MASWREKIGDISKNPIIKGIRNHIFKYNCICFPVFYLLFPDGLVENYLPANAGDVGSTPGSGRSPGRRNGNPPQYTCLENSINRGASWATVHVVTEESKATKHELALSEQFFAFHPSAPFGKPLLKPGYLPLAPDLWLYSSAPSPQLSISPFIVKQF